MPIVDQIFDTETVDAVVNSTTNKTSFKTAEKTYLVQEVETEEQAILAVKEVAEQTYLKMKLQSFSVSERLSDTAWKITASYSYVQGEDTEDEEVEAESTYSFDTSGGTKHLTQSIQTIAKYPATAPNFRQAIGVGDNNSISGIDITMPVYNWQETFYFKNSKITTSFKKQLSALTGRVNNKQFRGYAAGEVLFLGCSGSRKGTKSSDLWEITFKFAVSPNITNLTVGTITITSKKGWDYVWVKYASDADDNLESIITKPVGVYVEKVYYDADLRALGIGS